MLPSYMCIFSVPLYSYNLLHNAVTLRTKVIEIKAFLPNKKHKVYSKVMRCWCRVFKELNIKKCLKSGFNSSQYLWCLYKIYMHVYVGLCKIYTSNIFLGLLTYWIGSIRNFPWNKLHWDKLRSNKKQNIENILFIMIFWEISNPFFHYDQSVQLWVNEIWGT